MQAVRIQKRVGLLLSIFSAFALALVVVDRFFFRHFGVFEIFSDLSTIVLVCSCAVFVLSLVLVGKPGQLVQVVAVFVISAPTIYTSGSTSYFGLWIIVLGIILLYKYQFLQTHVILKLSLAIVWGFFLIVVTDQKDGTNSIAISISTMVFILINLVLVFFIFEEEIRELISTNKKKDVEIAEKEARIAELEPLSLVGERVAHVVHSFKNNLNQISTVIFLLEHQTDVNRASEKLKSFSKTMLDRIDNILMISQAGARRERETVDLARLIDGIHFVYLKEPTFVENTAVEIETASEVIVEAVKWDLILMFENILKNALEAITERGIYGKIRIALTSSSLEISNNGGEMKTCGNCEISCLDCPKFSKIGYTTKKTGSGHGIPQVLQTVREHGWDLRIVTQPQTTTFRISFQRPELVSPSNRV